MDDRIRPILLFVPEQDKVLSTFDDNDRVIPALYVAPPEESIEEVPRQENFYAACVQRLTELRGEYGKELLMVGSLPALRLDLEPHGETTFLEAVQIYADRAGAMVRAGCNVLLLSSTPTLSEARAAVLGARSVGAPLWITVDLDREGEEMEDGTDVLATFLTLQGLGVEAFGFGRPDTGDMMLPHLERIAPHAYIPLIARPECLAEDRETVLTPAQFSDLIAACCRLGVSVCSGGYGAMSVHLLAAKTVLAECEKTILPVGDADEIVLCTEKEVFYLDSNMEFSQPLECAVDMTEELLAVENESYDAVCVELNTVDDGYCFFLNSYLLGLPVNFLSDDEDALEAGLFFYPGRAIIDSRSIIEREKLEQLAARYGAVVV